MDAEHVLKIIRETREHLTSRFSSEGWVVSAQRLPTNRRLLVVLKDSEPDELLHGVRHVLWMLDGMTQWISDSMTMDAKKWEKVQRWLGFVQGALWALGIYTIDAMREQNSSPGVP